MISIVWFWIYASHRDTTERILVSLVNALLAQREGDGHNYRDNKRKTSSANQRNEPGVRIVPPDIDGCFSLLRDIQSALGAPESGVDRDRPN